MEVFSLSDVSDSETINEVETIRPTSVCHRRLYRRCLSNAVGWWQSATSNKSSRTATNSARTSSTVTPPEINALLSVSLMTLGERGYLPSGYIVSSLWVLKPFAQLLPTRYFLGTF
jgi:hypothetical protein